MSNELPGARKLRRRGDESSVLLLLELFVWDRECICWRREADAQPRARPVWVLGPGVRAMMSESVLSDAAGFFFAVWSVVVAAVNFAAFRREPRR